MQNTCAICPRDSPQEQEQDVMAAQMDGLGPSRAGAHLGDGGN